MTPVEDRDGRRMFVLLDPDEQTTFERVLTQRKDGQAQGEAR